MCVCVCVSSRMTVIYRGGSFAAHPPPPPSTLLIFSSFTLFLSLNLPGLSSHVWIWDVNDRTEGSKGTKVARFSICKCQIAMLEMQIVPNVRRANKWLGFFRIRRCIPQWECQWKDGNYFNSHIPELRVNGARNVCVTVKKKKKNFFALSPEVRFRSFFMALLQLKEKMELFA